MKYKSMCYVNDKDIYRFLHILKVVLQDIII